ncbi:MAG: Ig-like domain-containing protein [Treponema sp.]|nr:Ig-like domain-containing protein [Treponema sp.]
MAKRLAIFTILLVFLCSGIVWAGGNREGNVSLEAGDPSGFTDTIDTSERKPGRWNYYLEATDRAGNTSRAGPDNITIDPYSDLPQVSFINPMPGMRVQGNLNIVGIAVDDDGIDRVEFVITRGQDGRGEEIVRSDANGKDYWSYFLDTKNGEIWTDGFYTITAWATDITGLSGMAATFPNGSIVNANKHRKAVITFVLDRKKPDIAILSHDVGALVSGNIRMRGTTNDGNGIRGFAYSTDNGARYTAVRPTQDRRTGEYSWDVSINTRTLEDGPAVIWFQSTDNCGSVGTAAHLLFVNNTGPEVGIVHPPADTVVNGLFSIAGFASHPVGLKSVTWKAGTFGEGTFELLPGNQWWSANVDLRGQQRVNAIDIEIRAEDVSGNVTTAKRRYRVDQIADKPVVTLTTPVSGTIGANDLVVKGTARDDDGVASVFYAINSGVATEIPATGNFQFLIPTMPEGNNVLEVWAKDITGVEGDKIVIRNLVVPPPPPVLSVRSFTAGSRPADIFRTGMTLKPVPIINARTGAQTGVERVTMQIEVRASAAPASATVSFGQGAAIPVRLAGSGNVFTASVAVPDNLSTGLNRIQLKAVDRQNRETAYDEYIFVNRLSDGVDPGFEFSWVREKALDDGRLVLGSQEEILMGISSQLIEGVTVSGTGSNYINAEVNAQGQVIVTALAEGEHGPLTFRIQTGEGAQNLPPVRIIADFNGPIVSLVNVTPNAWVRTSVPVRFNVSSRIRVRAVEYSVDMGTTWMNFLTPAETTALRAGMNTDYAKTVDLTNAEDGSVCILIRAVSDSGKISMANFAVQKDTQAPQAALVAPNEGTKVNGTIRMGFTIEELGTLNTITYSRPARTGAPAISRIIFNDDEFFENYRPRFFEVLMDSIEMPLDNNMRFVFTDKAGNTSEISSYGFTIDQQMDIPVVQVILPVENEVITSDFIISGVMFDDDGIKNLQYRIDNGRWETIDAQNGFSIPVPLSSMTDNDHSITVIAEDIYGVRSAPVVRNFRVSLSEPAAAVTFPAYDTVLRDTIEIRGTSSDRNGIREVALSFDNGNTYNPVRGNFGTPTENVNWTYQMNTRVIKDGAHVVFIRVTDNYSVPATYASMINIDNTAPDVTLDSPGDGSMSVGQITIQGRAIDPNLRTVNIQLRGLDGQTIAAPLRNRDLPPNMIIRETLDLSGQVDGQYNIAVIATDRAGNVTRTSRNFELARTTYRNFVEILYPLENEEVSGEFNLYGFAGGANLAQNVTIRINGTDVQSTEVDDNGYFRFGLNSEFLQGGNNVITVFSNFGGGPVVSSRAYNIDYQPAGPWVTIDSFTFGDFAYDRPYLYGRSGYSLSEEEEAELADRATSRERRAELLLRSLDYTEISFDNGRTFTKTQGRQSRDVDYRYRLETGDMTEGMHYIIVRSTFKDGSIAVTRMLVQVDKTNPVVKLITPEIGGRYNTEIVFSASATDDVELVSLTYHLRIGDKNAYEVPGFLQGLYFESVIPPFLRQAAPDFFPTFFAGGATYMDFGIGLSFFDDNVKIQFQYGFQNEETWSALGGTPPIRYGGHVIAIKLLASIYSLPFQSFLGPDFEWLSATIAVGANFSLFDVAQEGYTQSGESTWLSALLLQIEFPRVTIPKRKYLRTFSLFTEGQLWFVPTDVNASTNNIPVVMPKVIMGLRLYIF